MDKEIRIKDFIEVIKRRIWFVIVITGLVTVAVGFYSFSTYVPLYQSSVRILVHLERPEVANTMSVMVKDSIVLDKVVEQLNLNQPSETLSRQIGFANENGSEIVKISVVDPSPERSAQIANTTASVFIREIGNILGIYDAKVISEAKVENNAFPINYNPKYKMDIGLAVGLVIGIGIVLFLDVLDDSIRSEKEVNHILGQPTLGSISKIDKKNLKKKYGVKSKAFLKGGTIDV